MAPPWSHARFIGRQAQCVPERSRSHRSRDQNQSLIGTCWFSADGEGDRAAGAGCVLRGGSDGADACRSATALWVTCGIGKGGTSLSCRSCARAGAANKSTIDRPPAANFAGNIGVIPRPRRTVSSELTANHGGAEAHRGTSGVNSGWF
jgi:hypothetical protein